MNSASAAINKISRPRIFDIVFRERLCHLLDAGRRRPVIWIHGPGGSGKSTLVASYLDARRLPALWYQADAGDADPATFFYYLGLAARKVAPPSRAPLPLLTPEYQLGLATFARRYFEALFACLKPPAVLVIDDYHEIADDAPLHDILAHGLATVPEGITAIIISRQPPPPHFIHHRSRDQFSFVGWDALRLTEDETEAIIRLRKPTEIQAADRAQLHACAQGWVAGLVLLLEESGWSQEIKGIARQENVFDYFAGQVFERLDPQTRQFLLASSILQELTPLDAVRLTGIRRSGKILAELHGNNYFTELRQLRPRVYRYHALFREFLHSKARATLAADEIRRIKLQAAQICAEQGRCEEAAQLYIAAGDWEGLTQLLLLQAQSLVVQGRARTLGDWLTALPGALCQEHPWLLFWTGVCAMATDLAKARGYFEQSWQLFRAADDLSGMVTALSSLISTYPYEMQHWHELDRWLALLDELQRRRDELPSRELKLRLAASILVARLFRQTDQTRIRACAQQVENFLHDVPDLAVRLEIGFFMAYYNIWIGNYKGNELLFAALRQELLSAHSPPYTAISIKVLEGCHYWLTAQPEQCIAAVHAGLVIASRSGVHVWDKMLRICLIEAAIIRNDMTTVTAELAAMEPWQAGANAMYQLYFHNLSAWRALLQGDVPQARAHLEQEQGALQRLGSHFHEVIWHHGMAYVHYAQGRAMQADFHLTTALNIARLMESRSHEFGCLLTSAYFAVQRGASANSLLRQGLSLGKEEGYLHFVWWQPKVMAVLCAQALNAGIETEYVQQLIRHRKLRPVESSPRCINWPWPVRIRLLGDFEIQVAGQAMAFPLKSRKPLEMLATLIALGGQEVREGQIADLLWPESDGDAARNAFNVTLYRLRETLGKNCLLFRDGRLALDLDYCWVDVFSVAALFARAEMEERSGVTARAAQQREAGLKLWRGKLDLKGSNEILTGFLAKMTEQGLRHFLAEGEHCRNQGEVDQALSWFQRALELNDEAEVLYQQIMDCHLAAGRRIEALKVYDRCCRALARYRQIAPSARTVALYRRAMTS